MYDVLLIRYSGTYHPRIYRGLLAAEGSRQRMAFYWVDPETECEITDSLAFSDFLFEGDNVRYWHHRDANRTHTLSLAALLHEDVGQLPLPNTMESLLRSVFCLVARSREVLPGSAGKAAQACFFQGARGNTGAEYTFTPQVSDAAPAPSSVERVQDIEQVLETLPFGRTYSRQSGPHDVVWRAAKVTAGQEVLAVAIRPMQTQDTARTSDMFDASALGRWAAVPECYRRYWSLEHQSIEVMRSAPGAPEPRQLHACIASSLERPLPDEVALALHKLLFTVSLETRSFDVISSSAQRYFQAYVRLAQEPVDRTILELGRIAEKLGRAWPEDQTRDFVLPLLQPLVHPRVFRDRAFVRDAVLEQVGLRGWSWYGALILENIQAAGCLTPEVLADLKQIVPAPLPTPGSGHAEPNELTPSMARFLEHLRTSPPTGETSWEQLDRLFEKCGRSLESPEQDAFHPEENFWQDAAARIRLFAGAGPFAADLDSLERSVPAFCNHHVSSGGTSREIRDALAVLVALSFYDTSTAQDHALLERQLTDVFNALCAEVEGIVRASDRTEAIESAQITGLRDRGIASIGDLVDNPLWPMFKFPLSGDERAMLMNRLERETSGIKRAAKALAAGAETGTDLQRAARLLELQMGFFSQRILMAAISLRMPKAYVTVRRTQEALPLITFQLPDGVTPEQASEVMTRLKYFYLGHRTPRNVSKRP